MLWTIFLIYSSCIPFNYFVAYVVDRNNMMLYCYDKGEYMFDKNDGVDSFVACVMMAPFLTIICIFALLFWPFMRSDVIVQFKTDSVRPLINDFNKLLNNEK